MSAAADRAPALGPRVWRVLLGNEWFKTRKRLAFWLTLGFFSFIRFMEHAEDVFSDEEDVFALPAAWSDIFSQDSVLLLIFACIALIMLVSSEFSWRTARQNVIDGLSKAQWFRGKAVLLLVLGLIFLVAHVGIPAALALVETDPAAAAGPLVPGSVVAATGALLLAFLSIGGLALFLSLAIRSAGPAMAAWFFWVVFGEQLGAGLLGRFFEGLQPILRHLPFSAAQQLMAFESFDATARQRMIDAAIEAGRDVPELPDLGVALAVNAGWALLFLGVAYVWFQRRDL